MRLSDAIRLGSMLKPQTFGWYQGNGGTCAMGAAVDAIGGGVPCDTRVLWPVLVMARVTCPECGDVIVTNQMIYAGGAMIVHLNDDHRWTRERIADWVATIEPPEAPLTIERAPDETFAWVQTASAARAD